MAKPAKSPITEKLPDIEETQEQYRQRIVDMVCEVTASTDKGLDKICKAFQKDILDFPTEGAIRKWLRADEELSTQYARAKEDQIEKLVEQIIDISDDDSLDMSFKEDGTPYVNTEHIQRSKLRVDSRKWIASKLKPKKYGDKITQEVSGPDGGPIKTQNVAELTDEQLLAMIAAGK